MPSSAVQMETRSPMRLFHNRAVKRKPEDDIAEGASWERELNQKECEAGSVKRPCDGLDHQSSAGVPWNTPYHLNMVATQNTVPVADAAAVAETVEDENCNGDMESMEMDMDGEVAAADHPARSSNADVQCTHPPDVPTSSSASAVVHSISCDELSTRSVLPPRCYCRPSWDPLLDLIPYVSDIY